MRTCWPNGPSTAAGIPTTGPRARRPMASCVTTRAYNTNSTVSEDTQAVYAQVAFKMELGSDGQPTSWSARATRKPRCSSANNMLVPTALLWQDDNDFQVVRPDVGNETLVTGDGSYNNLLPNLDFDIGADRFTEGALLVQQDDRARRLLQSVGGPDSGHARRLDAGGWLRPAGRAEQPGAVAARVRQLRRVARVLLLRQGLCLASARSRRTSRTSSATRWRTSTCTASATRPAVRARSRRWRYLTIRRIRSRWTIPRCSRRWRCSRTRAPSPTTNGVAGPAAWRTTTAAMRSTWHSPRSTTSCRPPTDPLYTFNVNTPINNKEAKIHGFEFGGQYFFGDIGLRRAGELHGGARRHRLRRDQRSERKPVRVAGPVAIRPTPC